MSEEKQEKVVLAGEEAMELWREGKEAWNAWVEENPDAEVQFSRCKFSSELPDLEPKTETSFRGFQFPDGGASFLRTEFVGPADFAGANFGDGTVTFANTKFLQGGPRFSGAVFGSGGLMFVGCQFQGGANFGYCKFGSRLFAFTDNTVVGGSLKFNDVNFAGPAHFEDIVLEKSSPFSFEGASFEGTFLISCKRKLPCPVDLRRTRFSHHVVINNLRCDFPKWRPKWAKAFGLSLPVAADEVDSQRFRRLKELALNNRNHSKALEFHIQEIQSRRGWETNWWQDIAQFFFWLLGDYGRSVIRPVISLALVLICFAGVFWSFRTPIEELSGVTRTIGTALTYSGSNLLAFIPTGRTAKQQGEELLFGGTVPDEILLLSGAQSIFAVILLFLLGLGLRNLFRV